MKIAISLYLVILILVIWGIVIVAKKITDPVFVGDAITQGKVWVEEVKENIED